MRRRRDDEATKRRTESCMWQVAGGIDSRTTHYALRNSQALRAPAIRSSLLTLLALFVLSVAPLSAQDGQLLSISAYRDRLDAARTALTSGATVAEIKASLAEIDAVQLDNGDIVEIEPLLAGVEDRGAALARLDTALAQLDAAAHDQVEERLAVLQHVRDRLALDRPTIWQRIGRWIEDLLDALMPDRMPQGTETAARIGSRLLVWTIVIAGGVLLAILLSYWLRSLIGGILADQLANRRRDDGEIPESAAEARSQAQVFAEAGNYRSAVRQLYLAALLHLDEQGILRFHRDQTNREVLAQTEAGSPVRSHLQPVVETFDRVWYGVREPDRQTFEAYRREIDGLMAEREESNHG